MFLSAERLPNFISSVLRTSADSEMLYKYSKLYYVCGIIQWMHLEVV